MEKNIGGGNVPAAFMHTNIQISYYSMNLATNEFQIWNGQWNCREILGENIPLTVMFNNI